MEQLNIHTQAGNINIKVTNDSTPRIMVTGNEDDTGTKIYTFTMSDTGKASAKSKVADMLTYSETKNQMKADEFVDALN